MSLLDLDIEPPTADPAHASLSALASISERLVEDATNFQRRSDALAILKSTLGDDVFKEQRTTMHNELVMYAREIPADHVAKLLKYLRDVSFFSDDKEMLDALVAATNVTPPPVRKITPPVVATKTAVQSQPIAVPVPVAVVVQRSSKSTIVDDRRSSRRRARRSRHNESSGSHSTSPSPSPSSSPSGRSAARGSHQQQHRSSSNRAPRSTSHRACGKEGSKRRESSTRRNEKATDPAAVQSKMKTQEKSTKMITKDEGVELLEDGLIRVHDGEVADEHVELMEEESDDVERMDAPLLGNGTVVDENTPNCEMCTVQFSFFTNRRQHCRACSRAVCAQCASNVLALPWLGHESAVRVCDACLPAVIERLAADTKRPKGSISASAAVPVSTALGGHPLIPSTDEVDVLEYMRSGASKSRKKHTSVKEERSNSRRKKGLSSKSGRSAPGARDSDDELAKDADPKEIDPAVDLERLKYERERSQRADIKKKKKPKDPYYKGMRAVVTSMGTQGNKAFEERLARIKGNM